MFVTPTVTVSREILRASLDESLASLALARGKLGGPAALVVPSGPARQPRRVAGIPGIGPAGSWAGRPRWPSPPALQAE